MSRFAELIEQPILTNLQLSSENIHSKESPEIPANVLSVFFSCFTANLVLLASD